MKLDAAWKEALAAQGVRPGPAASEASLHAVENRMGRALPPVLRRLYAAADGLFDDSGEWWIVWPVDRVASDNMRAWSAGELASDLLAFGDDGTGNPFCIQHEDRVVHWSWIDGAVALVIGDFDTFLVEWTRVSDP